MYVVIEDVVIEDVVIEDTFFYFLYPCHSNYLKSLIIIKNVY